MASERIKPINVNKKSATNSPGSTPANDQDKGQALIPTKINTAQKGIELEDLLYYKSKGLSSREIATLTGCSHVNVCERLKDANLDSLERYRDNKDVIIEHHQRRVSQSLTNDDIKKMSGLQKLIGIKLADEAIRTIRGQATDIHEIRSITTTLKDIEERCQKAGILADISNDNT